MTRRNVLEHHTDHCSRHQRQLFSRSGRTRLSHNTVGWQRAKTTHLKPAFCQRKYLVWLWWMYLDNWCVRITEVQISDFLMYMESESVYNGSIDHPFTHHGTMYKGDPCTTSVPILIHQYFNYSSLALGQGFTHGASSLVCRPPSRFLLLAVNRSSCFVFDCLQ